jgi:RsiW-degrading membrane proteinase PrsW (M82 family)
MLSVIVVATAPVWALLTFFYVRDRYDKEPRALLVRVFLYGMGVTMVAALTGVWSLNFLRQVAPEGSLAYLVIENFIVVALVEEGLKYWVVMRQAYRHPAFNEPYDGMIYAITTSLGFAALENILYVAQGGLQIAFMRGVLSVPGHALFAAAMGYYLGRAKFARTDGKEQQNLRRALLVPVLLHGTYDVLLSSNHSILAAGIVPFSIGMWLMALRQVRLSELRSPFRP